MAEAKQDFMTIKKLFNYFSRMEKKVKNNKKYLWESSTKGTYVKARDGELKFENN